MSGPQVGSWSRCYTATPRVVEPAAITATTSKQYDHPAFQRFKARM
jgi:hypothetical protein